MKFSSSVFFGPHGWAKNALKAGGLGCRGKWVGNMTFCLKNKKVLHLLSGIFNAGSLSDFRSTAWNRKEFLFSGLEEVPSR